MLQQLLIPMNRVDISARGVEMTFRYDGVIDRIVFTDGRSATVDADQHAVVFAAWEQDTLYIERSSNQGTRIVEAWQPDAQGLRVDYEILNDLLEERLEYSLYLIPRQTRNGEDP